MKKALRRIVVGGIGYRWLVQGAGEDYVVLRIWAADRPRRDFPLEIRLRCDNVWLHFGAPQPDPVFLNLTPRDVRALVEAALAAGWGAHHPEGGCHFVGTVDEERQWTVQPSTPSPT